MASLQEDIHKFVKQSKEKDSLVSFIKKHLPSHASALDKQLETMEQDIAKMTEGKMSYSQMRKLYG